MKNKKKQAQRRAAWGPLRAQIFRKVCFYEQKHDFWPIRTRCDLFKGTPKFIILNTGIFFQT